MSIITFKITDDHLKLIPFIKFTANGHTINAGEKTENPFGEGDFYEEVGLMIYGMPPEGFDPFSETGPQYDTEQKKYMESLFQDLPQVLEILLSSGSFQSGAYSKKYESGKPWYFNSKM